jgi:hypothetical protein
VGVWFFSQCWEAFQYSNYQLSKRSHQRRRKAIYDQRNPSISSPPSGASRLAPRRLANDDDRARLRGASAGMATAERSAPPLRRLASRSAISPAASFSQRPPSPSRASAHIRAPACIKLEWPKSPNWPFGDGSCATKSEEEECRRSTPRTVGTSIELESHRVDNPGAVSERHVETQVPICHWARLAIAIHNSDMSLILVLRFGSSLSSLFRRS